MPHGCSQECVGLRGSTRSGRTNILAVPLRPRRWPAWALVSHLGPCGTWGTSAAVSIERIGLCARNLGRWFVGRGSDSVVKPQGPDGPRARLRRAIEMVSPSGPTRTAQVDVEYCPRAERHTQGVAYGPVTRFNRRPHFGPLGPTELLALVAPDTPAKSQDLGSSQDLVKTYQLGHFIFNDLRVVPGLLFIAAVPN